MGERTAIEWAHHTFNPWVGCTRVSPACDNCYAEAWSRRAGQPHLWQGERRRTSAANWHQPIKWNRAAEAAGERHRVFCASLADVFDNQVPDEWRIDLVDLIRETPGLDWMLLTKRPQNARRMIQHAIGYDWDMAGWPWPNVWLGTSVEDRKRLINIEHLRDVPARIRFLSIEPLLEDLGTLDLTGIHLVIVGGESGPGARPMHPAWVRSIRDQCADAGVAFFFKQWGEWLPDDHRGDIDWDTWCGLRGASVWPSGQIAPLAPGEIGSNCRTLIRLRRIGKAGAGRLLDGREHSAMPELPPCV